MCNVWNFILFLNFFKLYFIFERVQAGYGQREGNRGCEAPSELTAASPMWGLNSQTENHYLTWSGTLNQLSHPGTPQVNNLHLICCDVTYHLLWKILVYIYERITEKMADSVVAAAATYFWLYGLPRMFQGLLSRERWDPREHTSLYCSSELLLLSPTTYLASLVQCLRGRWNT